MKLSSEAASLTCPLASDVIVLQHQVLLQGEGGEGEGEGRGGRGVEDDKEEKALGTLALT